VKNYFSVFFIINLLSAFSLFGQYPTTEIPGKPIVHYFPDSSFRKVTQSYLKNRLIQSLQSTKSPKLYNQTTAFYNPFVLRFATPPSADVLAVFTKATEIWSQFLVTGTPIVIDVSWSNLGPSVLGSAGPNSSISYFEGSPNPSLFYPVSLMEKLRGADYNNGSADIIAQFNSSFANWYIGVDGLPAGNQIDLLSVVLHELGHGLGFSGYLDANTSTSLAFNNYPNIFDKYAQDASGVLMTNTSAYPNNSNALFQLITGGNLFTSNASILSENTNQKGKLYAPSSYSSGSSVYHVDNLQYPVGNANALMTPSIAFGETTRDLGPIVRGLFKEMGWTKAGIYPDPMKDTEPKQSGYVFRARACYSSYYGDAVNNVKLFISENNGSFIQRTLSQSGDVYTFTLPYNVNTNLVRYYWTGTDASNAAISYPAKAQTYDQFNVQSDATPPTLSLKPNFPYLFATQTQQKFPPVSATDFSGIQSVQAIYKINAAGAEQTLNYTASTRTVNAYLATWDVTGIAKGDTLFYKIKGVDNANTPNTAYYPASGWIAVPVLGPKTAVNAFGQTFENIVTTDFFMSKMSIQTPAGFTSKSLNTPHPYANSSDFAYDGEVGSDTYGYSDVILLRPVTIQAGEGQMSFDEIALIEPGSPTAPFYSSGTIINRNFYDYAIVQGSKDGGATWVDLSAGWDANSDSNWLNRWNSATDVNGSSTATGIPSLVKTRTLSLTQNTGFTLGDQVMLRFRMMADYAAFGWGWLIDNLKIQGSTQTISNLEIQNSLPVIVSDKVYISNSATTGSQISLTVTDPDNDNLSYQMLSGGNLLGFGSRGKLTLLMDPSTISDISSIQLSVSDGLGTVSKTVSVVYCESTSNVTKNASNVTKKYSSNSSFQSTQKISGTSRIVYNASNNIVLQPGFAAEKGTVFEVKPGLGCL
jgi:hypothetical protein